MLTTGCSRPPRARDWAAIAEDPSANSAPVSKRVAVTTTLVTMGFSFNDEPTFNSQDELAVATSGSHNLWRGSNRRMPSRDAGLALPGVPRGERGTRGR